MYRNKISHIIRSLIFPLFIPNFLKWAIKNLRKQFYPSPENNSSRIKTIINITSFKNQARCAF